MSADERFEPERIVARLNEDGVRYVIVGGLAVGVHGVVRATRDVDLVPDPSPANMDRLAAALTTLGGHHPIEAELTGMSLARPRSIKVASRHGEIHVLNRMPGTPSFDEMERQQILVEIDDESETRAPICSLAHLRRMKRASERPRDAVDLAELDVLHGPE